MTLIRTFFSIRDYLLTNIGMGIRLNTRYSNYSEEIDKIIVDDLVNVFLHCIG